MYTRTVLAFLLSASMAIGASINHSPITSGVVVEIGKVGDKTFYEINEIPKLNWQQAKDSCASNGLDFGKTKNTEEFEFVYHARMQKDFWIGAAQKGAIVEYWDTIDSFEFNDGTPVPDDINAIQDSMKTLCMYASGDHHTYVDNCLVDTHHVLCEAIDA